MSRRGAFFLDTTIDQAEHLDDVARLMQEPHRIPDLVKDLLGEMDRSGSFYLVCQNGHGPINITNRTDQAEAMVEYVLDGYILAPRLNLATRQGNILLVDMARD